MSFAPSSAVRAPAPAALGRAIDLIVLHCSATPNGRHFSTADIDRWHLERGFLRRPEWIARQNAQLRGIGYHFVVYANGAIATGRHLAEVGAHAAGHNAHSVGVCLVGTDRFGLAQWAAAAALVARLTEEFPQAHVLGHRDLPNVKKLCPGFEVAAWRAAGMVPPAGHVLEAAA